MAYLTNVTITQEVNESSGNTSEINLASGATFTGTPVSTLGVVGLQWNLNTDQNCTLYSEESAGSHTGLGTIATTAASVTLTGTDTVFERAFVVGDTISVEGETDRIVATIVSDTELTVTVAMDNTDTGLTFTHYHWDISYRFNFVHKVGQKGEGETVQATMAYWRLRVVNEGPVTTTFFRVSGVLCPIATPLPSALSDDRRLETETTITGRENTERHVWVNPTNELAVSPVYRMVGTAFDEGIVLDDNFWSDDNCLRDGTVAKSSGEVTLETNTTANGLAVLESVRKSRFVAGSAQLMEGAVNWVTTATANNTRRVGAYTLDASLNPVDGFYFQFIGTTFSVGHCIGGSCTAVNAGNFNGNLGVSWEPTADTYYKISIEFTPMAVFWYINGTLLHKVSGHLSETFTLPITMENENIGGITTDISFKTVGLYIARQGELSTNQTSKFIIGDANTTICKRGAGVVKGIVISGNADETEIDFYDGTSDADTLLWSSGAINAKTDYAPIPVDLFGLPFNDGLAIKVSVAVCNVLVIYE